MTVGYAAVGAPPLLDSAELGVLRQVPLPPPDAIAERAAADSDPHVIKLANVALVEERFVTGPNDTGTRRVLTASVWVELAGGVIIFAVVLGFLTIVLTSIHW